MEDRIVIGGTVKLKHTIDGEASLKRVINGQCGVFLPVYPEVYTGELVVIPKAHEQQVLNTKNKTMPDDVTVTKVPYYETSNQSGLTVYIASEVQ